MRLGVQVSGGPGNAGTEDRVHRLVVHAVAALFGLVLGVLYPIV